MQPLEAFFRGSTSAGALLSENQLLRQEGGSTHFFTGRPDRTLRPNETLKKKARERERESGCYTQRAKKKKRAPVKSVSRFNLLIFTASLLPHWKYFSSVYSDALSRPCKWTFIIISASCLISLPGLLSVKRISI